MTVLRFRVYSRRIVVKELQTTACEWDVEHAVSHEGVRSRGPFRARGAGSVRPAVAGAWPTPPPISSTACRPKCPFQRPVILSIAGAISTDRADLVAIGSISLVPNRIAPAFDVLGRAGLPKDEWEAYEETAWIM